MDAGPTGTIAGTVTDAESGRPLAGAQVSVEGTARRTVTDAMGSYRINIETGTYTVQVTTLGYQKDQKQTSVPAGGTSTVNFSLAAKFADEEIVAGAITGQERSGAEG